MALQNKLWWKKSTKMLIYLYIINIFTNQFIIQLKQFGNTVDQINKVPTQDKNDFIVDASIFRFTFTFDLSWKTIKSYLAEKHGVVCDSPKSCLKAGFQNDLIIDENGWLLLTDMRNETVHTYNEELADKIYNQLPDALTLFQTLLAALKK